MGFPKSAAVRLGLCRFILVDQTSEDRTANDTLLTEVGDGKTRPWRHEVTPSMRTAPVVMRHVPIQHRTAHNDQQPVGDLGPDGAHNR